jgi:hypothetical protein
MTWAKQITLELVMVHCLECLFWVKFLIFVVTVLSSLETSLYFEGI